MFLNCNNFLILSVCLFIIGLLGFLFNRKNLLLLLLTLEMMLLSINFNFIVFSIFLDDITGKIFALMVLAVAAGESALGLAILIVYYRIRGGIAVNIIQTLRS